jgi:hypothetical protein
MSITDGYLIIGDMKESQWEKLRAGFKALSNIGPHKPLVLPDDSFPVVLTSGEIVEYETQYKDDTGAWQEITTMSAMPAWGTTSYSCEYCGNTEVSKYGACVGCGFSRREA